MTAELLLIKEFDKVRNIQNNLFCQDMKLVFSGFSQIGSCCKEELRRYSVQNKKLGTFQRISHGDSFRISILNEIRPAQIPPSRILDLRLEVDTGAQEIEFSWTAPGADFDQGIFNFIFP